MKREPDFVITRADGTPYLRRWWIIPRNRWFNIYLHNMLADDDDRALHDHPWVNVSIVLKGGFWEMVPTPNHVSGKLPGATYSIWRPPGSIVFRKPTAAHRLMLDRARVIAGDRIVSETPIPSWSLFITGPRVRSWGFHCPQGWVDWKIFTRAGAPGEIGKGCGE